MQRCLAIFAVLLAVASLVHAQEQQGPGFGLVSDGILGVSVPTRHIIPEDVVQESINVFRFTKPAAIAVRFTYTEPGARRMLAFKEAYNGQTVRLVIGKYQSESHMASLNTLPPGITNYAQWKEGWLKRRTDKVFVRNEEDAEKIVAGLKGQ